MLFPVNDGTIDRMVRFLVSLSLGLAVVLSTSVDQAHARAREKAAAKPQEAVNYDDPNMAYTPEYAVDTAVTCPKTLKARKLRECLIKNGLAASEEFSEAAELPSSTSFH
jgi:hypothetical protein